jgi:ABC-type cobalamin/Fe3+-siderophores transport system ATPase subunit
MSTSSNMAIEIEDLTVKIKTQALLQSLSLRIPKGQHLAIVGPNGAGKTTLLRSLMGLLAFHTGTIRINGIPLPQLSRRDIAHQIAFVPQELPSDIPFSVTEFIQMSRYAHQSGFTNQGAEDREVIQNILARTGLQAFADRPLQTLSGGERQKASIAAALAQQCPILILDEPCTHLDPKQQASVQALLAEINSEEQLTILTVTHDLNWAALNVDRILGLSAGELLIDAPPREFMQADSLRKLYQTTFSTLPHPESGIPLILPTQAQ